MNFYEVKGFQPWAATGIIDTVNTECDWLSLLTAYKETLRALEIACKQFPDQPRKLSDHWLSLARLEISATGSTSPFK